MAKHKKDPLLEALKEGRSYTWTVPEGGNFASMRAAIKHGQTLTMAPVTDPRQVQVGDIVLVRWHQGELFHMVGEIQGDQFLIVNSLGKVNGWVSGDEIYGRVTKIVDPQPRPSLPDMLVQLETVYRTLIQHEAPDDEDARRLLAIVDDLRWYAKRIGPQRWDILPKPNRWSFEQELWKLLKQVKKGEAPVAERVSYFIDCGKRCVGLASETCALFDHDATE
ncbi:MAG: hypothetical protein JXB85_03240 [Anaerolineales bacterium]|nr:hypothetical protein [Anaerolineales bacterium]